MVVVGSGYCLGASQPQTCMLPVTRGSRLSRRTCAEFLSCDTALHTHALEQHEGSSERSWETHSVNTRCAHFQFFFCPQINLPLNSIPPHNIFEFCYLSLQVNTTIRREKKSFLKMRIHLHCH